ncbi:hypothetical protein ACTXT7_001556 [Hymenolepis weldensis]
MKASEEEPTSETPTCKEEQKSLDAIILRAGVVASAPSSRGLHLHHLSLARTQSARHARLQLVPLLDSWLAAAWPGFFESHLTLTGKETSRRFRSSGLELGVKPMRGSGLTKASAEAFGGGAFTGISSGLHKASTGCTKNIANLGKCDVVPIEHRHQLSCLCKGTVAFGVLGEDFWASHEKPGNDSLRGSADHPLVEAGWLSLRSLHWFSPWSSL